ncbi:hypothetical protein A2686_01455 [Candidatus Woesebacteria bacterium RIFCSPHIGHO2_01_FULL_38_10]|uniref:Uncharacterized protein n=1 Tax=Candidatus Woesebacteria bacterium RIFCSPLOWO2_01_FULL_39_10b TaxID=1802517 RepID=A0A1F8B7D8_9BACT|nr:MAG: hypothetical protein A2686_01455 [Candidatus Woesebacteria bacterium RIFCSPHIGHO2_01_FULL_38_10]OGM59966.1 MAG: hypothetical protein A2892_03640 [Candidatus Woesebacteria bacterium RIFCSPLOWO2_01_FULL_39_10b]
MRLDSNLQLPSYDGLLIRHIENSVDPEGVEPSTRLYNRSQEIPALQCGDKLSSDMSSSLRGNPALLERGGCHKQSL